MPGPQFLSEFDPRYGECVEVRPGIRRVVANNPSKFTAWGTGTYIVGRGEVAIVDPGPLRDDHVDAVLAAVSGETVTHILVTHTHGDHSPAATPLQSVTGAPTYGFGPHPVVDPNHDAEIDFGFPPDPPTDPAGRGAAGDTDNRGAAGDTDNRGEPPMEEHADDAFVPDITIGHGDTIAGADIWFECLHTPGHISNHICFAERSTGALFPGDHVMGWSTTIIPPPDGSITDYLASLRLLVGRDDAAYFPTHGSPIDDPQPYVTALIDHRLERDRQIAEQISLGPRTIAEIVAVLYADVRPELHKPAARSVHAHIVAMIDAGRVAPAERRDGGGHVFRST